MADGHPPIKTASVTRAAGIVGCASFFSRILGFVRDVVLAWYFGAGLSSDAFITAFRIPEISRRLFVEGALTGVFIPRFSRLLVRQGRRAAFDHAHAVLRRLVLYLVLLAGLGVGFAPWIVGALAPGFSAIPMKFSLTVSLTRMMFPYVICVGLVALFMGILNVLGHFAAPAFAPAVLNMAIIASMIFISPMLPDSVNPVVGVALGVLIGGLLQLCLQVPFLIKNGFSFRRCPQGGQQALQPGGQKTGLLTIAAIFGSAAYQVNLLVITLLGSLLPEGSITYLYFADRLVQFPVGIFAVALATAVFPTLSRQAAAKDLAAVKETFAHAVRTVSFITLPAMVGLIVLREPIVLLLFKRGAFNTEAAQLTARALLFFGLGIGVFSLVKIIVFTFFALQDTWTPVKAAGITLGANLVTGVFLMQSMGHGGLALSLTLSFFLGTGWLVRALARRLGAFEWRPLLGAVCRSLAGALLMGAFLRFVYLRAVPVQNSFNPLFWGLMGAILTGLLLYGAYSFLVKSPELEHVLGLVRKGIKT